MIDEESVHVHHVGSLVRPLRTIRRRELDH
jgi:hypothetical protein